MSTEAEKQEPVAWMVVNGEGKIEETSHYKPSVERWLKYDETRRLVPLYTAQLQQEKQKPACWLHKGEVRLSARDLPPDETIPLYTTPPKILCGCGDQIMPDDGAECGTCVTARNAAREWVGLTDEDIYSIIESNVPPTLTNLFEMAEWVAKVVEAKLKEKNNAI